MPAFGVVEGGGVAGHVGLHRHVGRPLVAWHGLTARLAIRSAARSPGRTTLVIVALSIGIAMMTVITTFEASVRAATEDRAAGQLAGIDLLVESPVGVPRTVAARLSELDGIDAVIHLSAVSNDPMGNAYEQPTREINTDAIVALAAKAKVAGVKHFVELSIVGTDGLPDSPYLSAKAAQEKVITGSGLPYTIVRATQFHEFAGTIVDSLTDGEDVRVPDALIQPIAGDEVAAFLAEVAVEPPRNHIVNLGGPEKLSFADLARAVVARRRGEQTVDVDPEARYFGTRLKSDSLVTGPGAMLGSIEF